MAITPPKQNWWRKPLGKDERIWTILMALMIIMMAGMTVGWVILGDQNPPEQFEKVPADEFYAMAASKNVAANGVYPDTLSNGNPALSRNTSGDIYLVAQQFVWVAPSDEITGTQPNSIKLKVGLLYRIHAGSVDVLHGFQVIGDGWIISLQVVPGYDYIIDFTPTTTGTFQIVCNEYCGTGHHAMVGLIEVVP